MISKKITLVVVKDGNIINSEKKIDVRLNAEKHTKTIQSLKLQCKIILLSHDKICLEVLVQC